MKISKQAISDFLWGAVFALGIAALAGFAGWLTDTEDAPVKYQIQQRWIGDNTKGVRT